MKSLERWQTVFLVAGIGFFALSFIGMGLAPWTTLRALRAPAGTTRSPLEEEGRRIYIAEGCWHCHTQFVRPVANEEMRYGPVSEAAEYTRDIPQLFGTRRVGPDLAREAGKHSNDWHLAHLHNPRSTTPWSVMPAFPWLFEDIGDKMVPTRRARALVAYLQSLGRGKLSEMERADQEYRKNFIAGPGPEKSASLVRRGKELFRRECQGCHGAKGDGKGAAFDFLLPPARDFTAVRPTPQHTFTVLHTGVPGSAMHSFRNYPESDLWALAFYVEGLFKKPSTTPPVPRSSQILARGQNLYTTTCASCHGATGRGDGPAGLGLKPPPANFPGLRPSPQEVYRVLNTGIPGTAMVAYPSLSEIDRWALALFVEQLATKGKGESTALAPAPPAPPIKQFPPASATLLARGKTVFGQNCVSCHGVSGDGRGPAGRSLNPPPANLTDGNWKHGSTLADIARVVQNGVPGTGMASWQSLGEQNIIAVTYYVKSLTDPQLKRLAK